jgi:hypothetical protein
MTAMTLDEQLRRAFEALAERVRDEVASRGKALVEELTAAAEAERAEAVAGAVKDAQSAAQREAAERLSQRLAAAETTLRVDARRHEEAAASRLLAAIQAMDRGQSLSDILNALVDGAAAETRRAAMFLRRDGRLQSWRLAGFGDTGQGAVDLAMAESGLLGEAARTGAIVKDGVAPAFAALPPDRPAAAIPLVMSGQVFAVLYADQGVSGDSGGESWTATLEVLSRHAARALEAVTALRLAQVASERAKVPEGQLRIRN